VEDVEVSLVRKILRRFVGIHRGSLYDSGRQEQRMSFGLCGIRSLCHPEVEGSVDHSDVEPIQRCLDFARHDSRSFFAIEIVGFVPLYHDPIRR
jgi:hypothetical protein